MTDETAAPAVKLPDVEHLGPRQLIGIACALCERRLPATWDSARKLGTVERTVSAVVARFTFWACSPECPPRPAQPRSNAQNLRLQAPRASAPPAVATGPLPQPSTGGGEQHGRNG